LKPAETWTGQPLRGYVPVVVMRVLSTAVCALVLGGCWVTTGDGDKIRSEAAARDLRIEQLEAQSKQSREEIDQKLKELQGLIDRATAVLERGSADVGAQVEQLRDQVSTTAGQLAELQHRQDMVDQQLAAQRTDLDQQLAKLHSGPTGAEAVDPSAVPADKPGHFQAALDAYQAGDQEKARGLWREYLKRYPDDAKAGDAQYWIGASYTQQNKPATALGEYRKVIASFPKSNAVNVALFGMADAFYQLHACTDAKAAVDALLKRKPDAALTARAKKLRQSIERPGKGYCTS
jgi:TolA-binding protein